MDFASILSKEYADKLAAAGKKEMLDRAPIGTGPFQFVGYDKGAIVRFKSNPDYWGGKPAVDELVFLVTPDPAQRRTSLQSGECQIADPLPADIPALRADPKITVDQQEALDIGYLAYNTQEKPFDDARVRKALNMAIDKQAIVDTVLPRSGIVAAGPLPPTVWSARSGLGGRRSRSRRRQEAARRSGRGRPRHEAVGDAGGAALRSRSASDSGNDQGRPCQDRGQRQHRVISFGRVPQSLQRQGPRRRRAPRLAGDNGDPDNFLGALLSCDAVGANNRAEWCYQPFEDLIRKAKVTTDPAERARLYREAQAIFKEQAPWATLAHSLDSVAMSKRVKNYRIDAFGAHRFDKVDLAD